GTAAWQIAVAIVGGVVLIAAVVLAVIGRRRRGVSPPAAHKAAKERQTVAFTNPAYDTPGDITAWGADDTGEYQDFDAVQGDGNDLYDEPALAHGKGRVVHNPLYDGVDEDAAMLGMYADASVLRSSGGGGGDEDDAGETYMAIGEEGAVLFGDEEEGVDEADYADLEEIGYLDVGPEAEGDGAGGDDADVEAMYEDMADTSDEEHGFGSDYDEVDGAQAAAEDSDE
ncbi:hypothetical protein PTSG_13232, partial [Salpingoeca rosetta]